MIVRLKDNLIVITAETPEEQAIIAVWAKGADGNVFVLQHQDQRTFRLTGLGPRPDACREPINVTSRSPDAMIRLISNLAHTCFELDGNAYASVEAFWQGLKFPDAERRRQISQLHGLEARSAGFDAVRQLLEAKRAAGRSERYCRDMGIHLGRLTSAFVGKKVARDSRWRLGRLSSRPAALP